MDGIELRELERPVQRRSPGTSFPSLPLDEAVGIVQKVGAYGYRLSAEALAQYMGHSTHNSGAFRGKVAALREYGLIAGRGNDLTLTSVAQAIAHPESPEAELAAVRDAFLNSDLFATVYQGLAKGEALQLEMIANNAVRTHGVSPNYKAPFMESFACGAVEAGLAERIDDRRIRILANNERPLPVATRLDDEPLAPVASPSPTTVSSITSLASSERAVFRQEWPIEDGAVIVEIRSGRPLPASAFLGLGRLVEAAEALAHDLKPTARAQSVDSEDPPALGQPT